MSALPGEEGTDGLPDDLNAANEPTELFGVGGKATYTATAAGNRFPLAPAGRSVGPDAARPGARVNP